MKKTRWTSSKKVTVFLLIIVPAFAIALAIYCFSYNLSNQFIDAIKSNDTKKMHEVADKPLFNANLPAGAPIFLQFTSDYFHKSPLQVACSEGNVYAVKLLLENGAYCNFTPFGDAPPLVCTIRSNKKDKRAEIVHVLLKSGAKVTKRSLFEELPIFEAASASPFEVSGENLLYKESYAKANLKVFEELYARSKNADELRTRYGETLLMTAARGGNKLIVERLLDNKSININDIDEDGRTALFINCLDDGTDHFPNSEIIRDLIDGGIDVSIRDNNGDTAAMYVEKNGDKECAKLIESYSKK